MMWITFVQAKSFIRRQSWRLALLTMTVTVLSIFCSAMVVILWETDRDIVRSAHAVVLDIVLRDSADATGADEVFLALRRRPDVHAVAVMTPQDVWDEFQSEIGVRSAGLADIAAMPHLIRVSLRQDFVTRAHVVEFASSLRRRYDDVVESVVVPQDAIVDAEKRRADFTIAATTLLSLLIVLCVLVALITGLRLRTQSYAGLSAALGRSASWFRRGALAVLSACNFVGGLLCLVIVALSAPWIGESFPWIDLSTVPTLCAATTALVIALLAACQASLSVWPEWQRRG